MDRYTAMTVFTKVVETGGFTSTAHHFGISPAMVSTHIKTLEKRLGVRLLNRTTRRVSATEVGQNYYERCLHILSELEEAERSATDLQAAPRGRLRVTAPMTFGTRFLGPLVADYLHRYSDVSVQLSLDDRYVDLFEEGFDLAVRVGQLSDSSLIARKLTLAPMILCASPDYLERHGAPETPHDLVHHNCLTYAYSKLRSEWRFIGPQRKEETVQVSGRFLANSGDVLRAVAHKGAGIILIPQFIIEQELKAGSLIRLLPDYATIATPVHAVYPHSHYLSAKIRTFVDFLIARFNEPSCIKETTLSYQDKDRRSSPKFSAVG